MSAPRPVPVVNRLAVIAPHPDDESLGCGGLIAATVARGGQVFVVFVTDGGASHVGSASWPRARLVAQRRGEARASLGALGLMAEDSLFLDLPDAKMPESGSQAELAARRRLALALRAFDPSLVLLPWRRDPHCDHRDAWRLASAALRTAGLSPETLEYAVWLDELGEPADRPRKDEAECVVFDVAARLSAKRAAVAAHRTQTTDMISDTPNGFRLTPTKIERSCGPEETYWRVRR